MPEQSEAPSAETTFSIWRDARRARKQGPAAIEARQRRRLGEMVRYARRHSAFYAELYRHVPEDVDDSAVLPITSKQQLMARFDDWVTDPDVKHADVRAFVAEPTKIGERYLAKYTVATTSGTTGIPGIFLMDDRSMSVTSALAAGMLMSWLRLRDVWRIAVRRGRMSMIMASGGHYASTVAAARLRKSRGKRLQVLSSDTPIHELVNRLNEFQPALLAPYASIASLLATEQDSGRLHIAPVLMALSAEGLAPSEYDRIAAAFDTTVGNSYAATECPFLSYGCPERWLHVNADWVAFEPVDADYRPTPRGEPSHTVLISNLANRIQPILRYDLGDGIVVRPDPCPCGNPLPAIRVQGRAGDVLRLTAADGRRVAIPPLALDLDDVPGVELFQIAQTSATALEVRFSLSPGADQNATWRTMRSRLATVLTGYGLAEVTIALADGPPQKTKGGKHRAVIPL